MFGYSMQLRDDILVFDHASASEVEKNIAHEIGHYFGLLDYDGSGSSGNLMHQSATLGTRLQKFQWNQMHDITQPTVW